MASTRLRKTFHYPTDDGDEDDSPDALDEEEQEKLIAKLNNDNEEQNKLWLKLLLALPTVSWTAFLPTLVMASSVQARVIAILGITSLVGTAYALAFIPSKKRGGAGRKRILDIEPEPSPLHQYLEYLNGALSFLIALNALNWRERSGAQEGFWIISCIPCVVFCITASAKRIMLEVDVSGLENLIYGYKGA